MAEPYAPTDLCSDRFTCFAMLYAVTWDRVQPVLQRTGVVIQYMISEDLKQVHKPTDEQWMSVFLYADDAAWLAENVTSLKAAVELLHAVFCD